MISRENDNRFSVLTEHLTSAFKKLNRLPVIIERVTGKHNHIGIGFRCRGQYFWQNCQSIFVAETVIRAKMKIRAVNNGYGWV
jgi:hypothetical protein